MPLKRLGGYTMGSYINGLDTHFSLFCHSEVEKKIERSELDRPLMDAGVHGYDIRYFRGKVELFVYTVRYGIDGFKLRAGIVEVLQQKGFVFLERSHNTYSFLPHFSQETVERFLQSEGLTTPPPFEELDEDDEEGGDPFDLIDPSEYEESLKQA